MDERAYIARVEAAAPEELALLLARPTEEEERALRAYLGNERYARLHALALRQGLARGRKELRGNVVVLHGIMGGELSTVDSKGTSSQLWLDTLRLLGGGMRYLRLAADGRASYEPGVEVRATGIMKRHYGELRLSRSQEWNVRAFWFDWRKDLRIAAAELEAHLNGWFAASEPVHLVAHSMGGLVARTFIKSYPQRWEKMRGTDRQRRGGRLIMLGTPNHGTFSVLQLLVGLEKRVRLLELFDDRTELLRIINSFVGFYQMLPSPLRMPRMEPLYRAETYGVELEVSQTHLDTARQHHEWLRDVLEPERMLYIAGTHQATCCDIPDLHELGDEKGYSLTLEGDGRVPHSLGLLEGVETYYVDEEHGSLPDNDRLLSALGELLETGSTRLLHRSAEEARATRGPTPSQEALRKQVEAQEREELAEARSYTRRMRMRSAAIQEPPYIMHDERRLEELLTWGFLSTSTPRPGAPSAAPVEFPRLEVRVVHGRLDQPDELGIVELPIDALAVGHYMGVNPQYAELALDKAITQALEGMGATGSDETTESGILTQYTERGTLRGELGRPFFLPDPRAPGDAGRPSRVIVIAGMGLPGHFGVPELTVLSRELCWALGQMGKRHLGTVLIGSGNGNLSVQDAVSAWMRGFQQGLSGTTRKSRKRLQRLTFVELDPERVLRIHEALVNEKQLLRERLELHLTPLDKAEEDRLNELADESAQERRRHPPQEDSVSLLPTRVTLSLEHHTYRFGAITTEASIPEREIPLDPALVMQAYDELAAEDELRMQYERGRFLEKLLVPEELRARLATNAPLVMLLDSTTARIHWELVAQPDPLAEAHHLREFDAQRVFLGTCRGFTRQLRTTFAPLPEPPPPPRRVLRVLVVADPAADAHLPGAEEEGAEVAELFESFNRVWQGQTDNRVEVVALLGPREAKRTNVLRHLMLQTYDVLHFAGHCVYDPDPSLSGWLFTSRQLLTTHELNRIDRIPRFVFSNACESGKTPDRSEQRTAALAPSFAESFFGRGVANFVCTAWPVDDTMAREFERYLYASLLGMKLEEVSVSDTRREERPRETTLAPRLVPDTPREMYVAMREARLRVLSQPGGERMWGAYQHYGNPHFRFFEPGMMRTRAEVRESPSSPAPPAEPG